MSSLNKLSQVTSNMNHAGLPVRHTSVEQQLMRSTLAHMLWEDGFYEEGVPAAERVASLVAKASTEFVEMLAVQARTKFKLRHVPLLLVRELARTGKLKAGLVEKVIQRPDEMGELLSMYWKDGKIPVSNQLKKGIAQAFIKFNEYQLAKHDKNSAKVSIRDVMFLTHPQPQTLEQEVLFAKIASNSLETPDTWETNLSAGANKAETFTRLMVENKLGALAFLRNLRNILQSGIDSSVIREYAKTLDVSNVLPFRYIAAARVVPELEDMLETMMFSSLEKHDKLPGKTVLMVDVSGSMFGAKVSAKSDLDRFDAAAALAVLLREICEEVEIYSFSNSAVKVPPRRGFALVEAILNSQLHGGTKFGNAKKQVDANATYDRIISITDEQSYDSPTAPKGTGYILNVASYKNGINEDSWVTITGFSESVIDYIKAIENINNQHPE